ncbi:MAG: ABC transporter permease [Bacillati bacterium ANGP1]|uniref:ABC transporter permease n=1 Tax=Candidatus Segetimicrobium genomatis TaxID=2569760 RepID=A0A537K7G5_9BACT|nr:MAG: ABC transporter permease [Terrabacteria group bacterium ANGP1]
MAGRRASESARARDRGGRLRRGGRGLRRFARQNPLAVVGGLILLSAVLACALAPVLTPSDPIKTGFSGRLRPPVGVGGTWAHLMGTDNLGRDIWARVLYGGRVSLALATGAVLLAAGAGVALGLLSGYTGGRADDLVMRLADIQLAFPVIMLAIAIIAVVGTSELAIIGVLALSGWVLYARTVRANLLSIRSLEYVEAARALGAGGLRIIVRHILPNTTAPILVIGSAQFATMVLLETGLSFLGLGIQAPRPSWGNMMAEGRDYLSNAWWLATIPGAAISLVVLGANLFGDGLRDLLDPRLRHR